MDHFVLFFYTYQKSCIRVRYLFSTPVRNPRMARPKIASSMAPSSQFICRTQAWDNTSYKKLRSRKQSEKNWPTITDEITLSLCFTTLWFLKESQNEYYCKLVWYSMEANIFRPISKTEMQPLNINKYSEKRLVSLSDLQEDIMSPWIIQLEIACFIRNQFHYTT